MFASLTTRFSLLLILFVSTPGFGDTLVVAKTGYWILSQDATGNPTLKKLDSVIHLDTPTNPPVDPPTNPPLEVHRTAVKTATAAVNDPNKVNTKKALSELYRTVAGLPVTSRSQLNQATDTLFSALNLPLWDGWKISVDKSLAGFVSLDDARKAWIIVAEVLSQ